MNIWIGGTARIGKTELAKRVRQEIDGEHVHCDAIKGAVEAIVTPETHPDILMYKKIASSTGQEWLKGIRARDRALWPAIEGYVRARNKATPDAHQVIEGNVWPDFLEATKANRTLAQTALYLIDTSPPKLRAERLIAIRNSKDGDNNWMSYDDEGMVWWATLDLERSKKYKALQQEMGAKCFDLADFKDISDFSHAAFEYATDGVV